MVDKDVVEDFEEEETLLAHVDANQGWKIDIDTLVGWRVLLLGATKSGCPVTAHISWGSSSL